MPRATAIWVSVDSDKLVGLPGSFSSSRASILMIEDCRPKEACLMISVAEVFDLIDKRVFFTTGTPTLKLSSFDVTFYSSVSVLVSSSPSIHSPTSIVMLKNLSSSVVSKTPIFCSTY